MKFDIYSGNEESRFLLGCSGSRPCFVVGLNPSTATPLSPDQVIRKVSRFIELDNDCGETHDGFIMINLYPARSTDPSRLPQEPDKRLVSQNRRKLLEVFGSVTKPTIWAAWGDLIESRHYLLDCLHGIVAAAKSQNPIWKQRGNVTEMGNPRHPCRQGYCHRLSSFAIDDYLREKRDS